MKLLNIVTLILVIVGAMNWGLVGLFNFDLVKFIFLGNVILTRLVYAIVGLAGIWSLNFFRNSKLLENLSSN